MRDKITAELEACFASGLELLPEAPQRLPAELLGAAAGRQYCIDIISRVHGPYGFSHTSIT